MAVPTIQSVYVNGTNLKVSWATVADASITAYVVTVFFGTQTVFTSASFPPGNPPLQTGSLDLPGGLLDASTSYFVQVSTMWGSSPGQNQSSQLVPLITRLPALQAGYYDGTDFHLQWEPSDQASQGYFLQLYGSAGSPFTATVADPRACWGTIPGPTLVAGQQWYAQVAAVGTVASDDGDALYATLQATPLLASPQPALVGAAASYQRDAQGGFITATWTPLQAASGVTRYRLQCYAADGTPGSFVDIPGVASNAGTLFLSDRFEPGSALRVLALDAAGIGVATPASPVVATPPALTGAAFAADNGAIGVAWHTTPDPLVTGFAIQVYDLADPSQVYTQSVAGAAARTATFTGLPSGGLDADKAWGIRVCATGAAGTAPAIGAPWRLPATAPTVSALRCADGALDVAWQLPATAAAPAAYVLSLWAAGALVASQRIQGGLSAQGRLFVPDAGQTLSVSVAAVGAEGAIGPGSAAVTALVSPVTGLSAVTDAATGLCTLSWPAVANANAYLLDFGTGAPATQAGTSYSFAQPLPPNADLSVRVTPLAVSAGLRVTGPSMAPHRLPTRRGSVLATDFDAATMSAAATWQALPGATGYRLALIADASGTATELAHTTAPAGATTGTVSFPSGHTPSAANTYRVLVQGQWGEDRGPQANQPPIFTAGFHLSSSAAGTAPPFVYPATSLAMATSTPISGEPLTLYLPDIGAGSPLTTPLPTQGAFALVANTDAAKNNGVYPYALTISNTGAGNNPWSFAPAQAIRTGLASDVLTFLKAVEAAGAVSWGIVLLQQVLARALPQTFAEQLYYNFGLTFPGGGAGVAQACVDLRPGMVLRVVPNPYQSVPGQAQGSWLSGFVGAASIDYDVGSMLSANGAWSAGFDPFIGQLVANGALSVAPPQVGGGLQQGVAEAADLYFPAFAQPFYRLFVPNALVSPSGIGSATASDNFVLAAAPSLTALSNATSAPSAGASVAYFRGRAVLKPCLRVSFDGMERVVPVGTTLGNLLEQYGRLGAATPPPLAGVGLERGLGGAVLDPNAPAQAGSAPVALGWRAAAAAVYGPGWGVTALPLLPGDRITLDAAASAGRS